jgi:hypothetical protein
MECEVCYSETATCKLVCKHSFCKSCVKSWYQKSEEPTCPMCRSRLYFKGLYKLKRVWEDEKFEKQNSDYFQETFDEIFEDDDEFEFDEEDDDDVSNPDEDEDEEEEETHEEETHEEETQEEQVSFTDFWKENHFSNYVLDEIVELQKQYQKSVELGVPFDWYMENIHFIEVSYEKTSIIEDDVFPHQKNIFVSKYEGFSNTKRTGKRIPTRTDKYTTVVLVF